MNTLIKEEIVSMIKVSTVEDVENKIKELEDKYQYYEDNSNMKFNPYAHEYYNMIPCWVEGLKDYLISELNENQNKDGEIR